jgi:hypothetical protein
VAGTFARARCCAVGVVRRAAGSVDGIAQTQQGAPLGRCAAVRVVAGDTGAVLGIAEPELGAVVRLPAVRVLPRYATTLFQRTCAAFDATRAGCTIGAIDDRAVTLHRSTLAEGFAATGRPTARFVLKTARLTTGSKHAVALFTKQSDETILHGYGDAAAGLQLAVPVQFTVRFAPGIGHRSPPGRASRRRAARLRAGTDDRGRGGFGPIGRRHRM